jgi:tripartite-type tricarboxylate transporter receptor subunit TctC
MKKLLSLLLFGLAGAGVGAAALGADNFPSRPITLVVPFPAGGVGDLVARSVAPELSQALGQSVLVENKAGASAIIGSEFVARAAPDGYTLLVASLPVLSINPLQYKNLPYAPQKDLAPVALLANQPYLIAVRPSVPVDSLQEFVALAKKEPGKFNFGSSSSSIYLATELLGARAGIELNHIPYKGSAPALNDLLGGHIDLLLETFSTIWPQAKEGKLKALAITAPERSALAPGVPSYTDSGLKDMNITSWQAIMAPAGTPAAVIDRLNRALNQALQKPAVIGRLQQYGMTPVGGTPDAAASFIKRESDLWQSIAKQVNMVPGSM